MQELAELTCLRSLKILSSGLLPSLDGAERGVAEDGHMVRKFTVYCADDVGESEVLGDIPRVRRGGKSCCCTRCGQGVHLWSGHVNPGFLELRKRDPSTCSLACLIASSRLGQLGVVAGWASVDLAHFGDVPGGYDSRSCALLHMEHLISFMTQ